MAPNCDRGPSTARSHPGAVCVASLTTLWVTTEPQVIWGTRGGPQPCQVLGRGQLSRQAGEWEGASDVPS